MSVKDYIRKDLANFAPYHAPLKSYDIKVDANENPFAHAPEVLEKAENWLANKDNITRYPDTDANALREKLSSLYKLEKENFICGVGSDQLIEYTIKCFIEPGDKILVPNPSFSMYGISNALNHGVTVPYELDDDFNYDVTNIIEVAKEVNPKLLFVCTPNNPTGSSISNQDILTLLDALDCPIIVDEAYDEFIDDSMVKYLKDYDQLLILRTFSKAYGCAGLRVGYGIGNKSMIDALNICKSPYNVPSFSQAFAVFVLESVDYYLEKVAQLKQLKDSLYEKLKDISYIESVYPSVANFILIKANVTGLVEYLESNGILVRAYRGSGRLENCYRISIGDKNESLHLIKILNAFNI